MKEFFLTGEIARICKVSQRTVRLWFDSGKLEGYRNPLTTNRCISREHLIKFLKDHDMPLGELEEKTTRVLVASQDRALANELMKRSFKVEVASDSFQAGLLVGTFRPDCVIVSFSIGSADALQVCKDLRGDPVLAKIGVIVLTPDAYPTSSLRQIVDEVYAGSCSPQFLAQRVDELVRKKK